MERAMAVTRVEAIVLKLEPPRHATRIGVEAIVLQLLPRL